MAADFGLLHYAKVPSELPAAGLIPPAKPRPSLSPKKAKSAYRRYEECRRRYELDLAAQAARNEASLVREPLPDWAEFLMRLGGALAGVSSPPTTVALTLPTRQMAAALACAGAVVRRAADREISSWSQANEQLERLRRLAAGAEIRYVKAGSVSVGLWAGVEMVAGDEKLCFQVRRGLIRKLPASESGSFQFGTGETPGRVGSSAFQLSPIAQGVVGSKVATRLSTFRSLEVVAVGIRRRLIADLQDERIFRAFPDGTWAEGRLQDLVMARGVGGTAQGYWSELISSQAELSDAQNALAPRLVVFDDYAGYRRWHERWPNANQLVLIDRSRNQEAVDAHADDLTRAFADRDGESPLLEEFRVPSWFEALAFERGSL